MFIREKIGDIKKRRTKNKIKLIFKKIFKNIFIVIIGMIKPLFNFIQKIFLLLFILFLFIGFAWWSSETPSLYREWTETEAILPEINIKGDEINIKNIRNFNHISKNESVINYYDDTFDLEKIESLYYIIEPFSDYDGPAHTMLSFGFSDGKYLTVSAELRKEKGEGFDPFLGLMNQFEIVYIIGNENDLIKLRANIRNDIVRLYPMKVSKDKIKKLFTSVIYRADKLTKEPEFYNTLWNTCTTSILRHVNSLREEKIASLDMKILLPSNSDKIAFDLGLIDTNLTLDEAREYYKINTLSAIHGDNENYSELIRVERK